VRGRVSDQGGGTKLATGSGRVWSGGGCAGGATVTRRRTEEEEAMKGAGFGTVGGGQLQCARVHSLERSASRWLPRPGIGFRVDTSALRPRTMRPSQLDGERVIDHSA